ncbi:MAG: NifB/NifX family molybdenum-iron cluster-binding protein [Alphaproteobacteria bacterium]
MPRPRKSRIIQNHPVATLYKPRGIPSRDLKIVTLPVEGLEALRLADVEKLDHEKAAMLMDVSRPTFSRILSAARAVTAEALVNGWGISIHGGDFVHADDLCQYACRSKNASGTQEKTENSTNLKEEEKMSQIIVSSMGTDINSKVDPRFGRATHFLIVDPNTMEFEHLDNAKVNEMGSGAGIQTAELIAKTGAKIVLTGSVGPKASQALVAADIQFFENFNGMTVQAAIQKFIAG